METDRICGLKQCTNEIPKGKYKYCCDRHRRYAYKKRHWEKYLAWQREYTKRKRREEKARQIAPTS